MIVTSKFPSVAVPDVSLATLMLETFDRHGDAVAVVDATSGKSFTFKELSSFARKLGSAMIKRGLQKGDVFAIHLPKVPDYAIVLYGVPLVGGVTTPLNPNFTEDELLHRMQLTKAKYIITTPSHADLLQRVSSRVGMKELFVLGSAPGCTSLSTLLEDDGSARGFDVDPRNDVFYILYTSGTTGLPKGVMLTHRNLVTRMVAKSSMKPAAKLESDQEAVLVFLPFFGSYMLGFALICALFLGQKVVCMETFDEALMVQYIEKFKITSVAMSPSEVVSLVKSPALEGRALSSLRSIVFSGGAIKPQIVDKFKERLPKGIKVIQGYGMIELGPTGLEMPSMNKPGGFFQLPNFDIKVIDVQTGALLGPGEEGELCFRSPAVMKGYLNNPQATAAALDGDGWLRTGDLGHYDEDQAFFITGRIKEIIKYSGFQVAPAELEAVLLCHELVADAAVVGFPDEEAGQLPKAFVVPRGHVTPAEIADFVHKKVAPLNQLRGGVEFVDAIPKNSTGKILRRELMKNETR